MKVQLVQICDNIPLHLMSQSELMQIRETTRENGITVEIGTRGIDPDHLLRYLDIGKLLGSPLVRTILSADLRESEEALREVLPSFEKTGIRLGIENYEQYGCGELAALLDRLGSPLLGVCLDPVNSFGLLECPEGVVELLSPRTFSFHVKDFTIRRSDHKMGYVLAGTPAGEGMLEIEQILGILQGYRSDISVVLELWTPCSGDMMQTIAKEQEWARRSIEYLRRIVP